VIDLGCGDGSLLKFLQRKKITGEGIELSESGVKSARKKGLNVRVGTIDKKLKFYKKKQFDYSICNVTLPMTMYPEVLISEMTRISKRQIISFPNFAFLNNRLELLFKGRMPKTMLFGYEWYSTGLIHQLSIRDFENFCKNRNCKIIKKYHFTIEKFGPIPKQFLQLFPNLWTVTAVYMLEGK
jgi:methionine biosynthesis protein MetW